MRQYISVLILAICASIIYSFGQSVAIPNRMYSGGSFDTNANYTNTGDWLFTGQVTISNLILINEFSTNTGGYLPLWYLLNPTNYITGTTASNSFQLASAMGSYISTNGAFNNAIPLYTNNAISWVTNGGVIVSNIVSTNSGPMGNGANAFAQFTMTGVSSNGNIGYDTSYNYYGVSVSTAGLRVSNSGTYLCKATLMFLISSNSQGNVTVVWKTGNNSSATNTISTSTDIMAQYVQPFTSNASPYYITVNASYIVYLTNLQTIAPSFLFPDSAVPFTSSSTNGSHRSFMIYQISTNQIQRVID